MKNSYSSLLLIFLLFPVLLFSQSKIGVFGGLNMAKLSGDAPEDSKYKNLLGLNAGAHFDIKLSPASSLNLGLAYLQQGTKVFYKIPKVDDMVDSLQFRLNYFSIPISFKVNSINERYYALAGLEAGYLLNKKLRSNEVDQEIDFTVSDFNLSIHFGVGIRIPIGFPLLFIEARYNQGIFNITDDAVAQNIIPRVKTNGVLVLAGIEIPLSKNKSKN